MPSPVINKASVSIAKKESRRSIQQHLRDCRNSSFSESFLGGSPVKICCCAMVVVVVHLVGRLLWQLQHEPFQAETHDHILLLYQTRMPGSSSMDALPIANSSSTKLIPSN